MHEALLDHRDKVQELHATVTMVRTNKSSSALKNYSISLVMYPRSVLLHCAIVCHPCRTNS